MSRNEAESKINLLEQQLEDATEAGKKLAKKLTQTERMLSDVLIARFGAAALVMTDEEMVEEIINEHNSSL